MPQIETHVFGSKDGYETLAHSAGLSSIELAELDGLGFGQSSDPRVLAQLSTNPTALGRFLTSGRFAITRCVQGPPDDAGRATFRLLTIVLDAHDYLSDVRHRLSSLLEDRTLWDVDRFSNQKSLRGRSGNPTPRDARSSAIAGQWAAATGATRTACFVEEPDGDQLVLRVVSELPEIAAQQLSWGVRLFSAGTQATLFTTVPGVPLSASRKIVRVSVAAGSPVLDPQRFGQGVSNGDRPVPRSPMRFARNPLVLSAFATLVILIVGFWPTGSQKPSRQALAPSSAGVQNRAFEPSQRTLSVAPSVSAPEPAPEAASESASESAPEAASEPAPEAASESASESAPEAASEAASESASESAPEAASEPAPEAASESASESAPEAASEPAPEAASESASESAPEAASEAASESASESAPEAASEPAPEAASESASESAPEAASESAPEAASESAPEAASESASESAPEAAPEPEPETAHEPELNLDPNHSGASESMSNEDCEEWEAALKSFKDKVVKVKSSLEDVARTDFGSVEKSSDKKIRCTESESLRPKLSHFRDAVAELGDWTFVEKQTHVIDGKVVVVTNSDKYERDKKFRVMAVLHLWKEFQPTQLLSLYEKAKKKSQKLASLIDEATGEYGTEPSGFLPTIQGDIQDLFGDKSQLAFFKLLDRSLGAEGDLFLWVNSYPRKTYEELVEISREDHGVKEDRKPPNPGLLLDELPCQGGVDESSD